MSNAQNYNKALGLAAQAHTDKYNTTKTRGGWYFGSGW